VARVYLQDESAMTLSSTEKLVSSAQATDLKRIKGIGRVKQQWLNDTLHITTLEELAQLNITDLELASSGIVTRTELAAWVTQAQTLVSISSDTSSAALADNVSEPTEPDWTTDATFTVLLQSQTQPNRPNANPRRLLLHHADLNGGAPLIGSPAIDLMQQIIELVPSAAPAKSSTLAVEIFQVSVHQRGMAIAIHDDGHALNHPLRVGEPFALMVRFRLSGLLPTQLEAAMTYTTQCFARNRTSGKLYCLAAPDPTPISPNQLTYQVMLSDLELTRPGLYRLQILTTLQGTPAMPGCFELPMLHAC
jgi:hypothetical protein